MMSALRFKVWMAALAVTVALSSVSFGQELPKIAVYVTGAKEQGTNKALGTRMLSVLVNSGKYQAVERSEEFLRQLDAEHVKQRSGAIDDGQISALGRQFGVKFVCIADITPALGSYQVSARIVDVETASVVAMGDTNSPLESLDDLTSASTRIVDMMFGNKKRNEQPQSAQTTPQTIQPGQTVIQTTVIQTQYATTPKPPKVRKHDYYIAPKYILPVGIQSPLGAFYMEGGVVWGDGTFMGIDYHGGGIDSSGDLNHAIGGWFVGEVREKKSYGFGLNYGRVYDLPHDLQLVYGGAVGVFWEQNYYKKGYTTGSGDVSIYGDIIEADERKNIKNNIAPFVRLRYKYVEVSYRMLLGGWEINNTYYSRSGNATVPEDKEDSGWGVNSHQIMLGVHFATSKRGR